MDFSLSSEHEILRESVRSFAENEIKPVARDLDEKEEFSYDTMQKMAELGLFGVFVSDKYGGQAMDYLSYIIAVEEIARVDGSHAATVAAENSLGIGPLYYFGNEEQKKKYLPKLCKGETLWGFGLTEPNAGSDAYNPQTTAEDKGDHYLVNGGKIFITNGSFADIFTTFVKTVGGPNDGKMSVLIVEKEFKGFKVGKIEEKMGIRGSETAELIFEDMKVPKENLLGREGRGLLVGMKVLNTGRLGLGAAALGAAKEALALSAAYSNERVQFGKKISQNQGVQWMLADMAVDIYNMESILYRTAWMYEQGMNITRESSIVKLYCSEALDRIVDKAMQIYGGYGFTCDFPIERMYRDSRINRIFEGTSEIQRMIIARDVLHAKNL